MKISDYLKSSQPKIFKLFSNALKLNKISQGYLLVGDIGAPLMQSALFFAKSLVCKNSSLACEECSICKRIDDGNYADLFIIDGHSQNIKISDIQSLQEFCSRSPLEKGNKIIYIINELENANKESLNALLKFLEEPNDNVYCFITVHNLSLILPTIISRLEVLKFLPENKDSLVKEAIDNGLSLDDSEIIASFTSTIDEVLSFYSNKTYTNIKDSVFDYLFTLKKSTDDALYFVESELINLLKDRVSIRLFIDILSLCFLDMIKLKHQLPLSLPSQKDLFTDLSNKLNHLDDSYIAIMESKTKLELNLNVPLLLEHLTMIIGG